jgi:SAM-dependent methyltransferase
MTDAAFWDRIAPRYARQPISDIGAYEATLARVKTYLSDKATALELGCGTGSTALLLAPHVRDYEGTDISGGMIDIALEKAWSQSAPNVGFRQAGVDAADHAGASPDIVLAFNLLHLVPDTEATLAMVSDLLPEGGLFISKTPCIGAKWYYRPLVRALQMIGKAPFVRFLKVAQLDHMMVAAGFEIVETGLYPPRTPSRFIVARKR